MDDIHTPTVPSGPSAAHDSRKEEDSNAPLTELITQKQRLEEELKALSSVLDSVSLANNNRRLLLKY